MSRLKDRYGVNIAADVIRTALRETFIVPATAQAFLERTFGSLPLGEWDSWVTLLSNYYECEGSLQQTADRLYLHKNTLGARLDRFERLTHLNPRSRADGAVLQVAIELYHRQSTPS